MTIQLENGNTDPDEGIPLNTENGNGEQVYKTTTKQNSKKSCFLSNLTKKQKFILITVLILFIIFLTIVITICLPNNDKKSTATKIGLIPPNPEVPQGPSGSVLHIFKNGAVCSDSDVCSQIGKDIYTKGGNVVDATIATMFCAGITTMQSMGLGGGFIMNIYIKKDKKAYSLNAKEEAVGAATEDMFAKTNQSLLVSPLSIGIPGELKGLWEAYQRFGSLPWKNLVEPAIGICENGFLMSKHMEDGLQINSETILKDLHLRGMFFNETSQKLLKEGSLIKPGKLCDTLKIISTNGGNDLYNGTLAKMLAEDLKEVESIVTNFDLAQYKVRWDDSIKYDLNGDQMFVTPLPSGGVMLGYILNVLKGYNITADDISTEEKQILLYHRIAETFKFAFAERTKLGDPNFVDVSDLVEKLTSMEYAESIRMKINDERTSDDLSFYGSDIENIGVENGTSHLSLLAPNGDAVSVTSTVNFYFGCGLSGSRTGIIFNNGMDDFSVPGKVDYFGYPGAKANYIRPYKRGQSSMSPTIITDKNGDVKLVIGAAGGTKIPTAIAVAIIKIFWLGQNIKEAVDAPRIHHQLIPNVVEYEYGIMNQIVEGLEKRGHKTQRYTYRGSIICAIYKNETGIYANADFRKKGDVVGL